MSGELGIEIDLVAAQLALSLAAIHTTTEATCQALTHLAKNPQWFQPLRDEIIEVIGQNGWTRSSIYQFKLMDSFLKESQRLSRGIGTFRPHPQHRNISLPSSSHITLTFPSLTVSLQRIALDDVVFPDGLRIAKGTRILIENKVLDPETWPNPDKFDASRFMKLSEETGQASNWQYVSNQPEHMGFGIGYQACPGEFWTPVPLSILSHTLYTWF
jgi:cytochrome P450